MWKQVIAPTVLVSVLWIAISVPTTYYLNLLFDSQQAMAENIATVEAAWKMRRDTWRLQAVTMEAVWLDARSITDEIREIEASFMAALDEARRTSVAPPQKELVERIQSRFVAYRDHLHARLDGAVGPGPRFPTPARRREMQQLATAVSEACRELLDVNQQMIRTDTQRSERLYSTVVIARVGFLLIAPALGLLLGWWVARRLNRSISQISVNLRDATGRLGPELGSVAVSTTGELPALEKQVHVVADRIRGVVNELEQTRQRVIQAEQLAALGELAAGVAHEVRNPLTSVKLLIQTASQRQPRQPLSEKQLEVVLQEISRIESMIQGMLDFARPPRLRPVHHDLRQTVRRALNLVQGRADLQKVTIEDALPDAPVAIRGDPEQLHLVFGNLAINGVEAMSGGGTLRVSVQNGDGRCRVTFSDTGPGISASVLDRLFEPFVTSKERGTGLGLAISRRIVLEHRGMLLGINRPEGGAAFTVELPLHDPVMESASSVPSMEQVAVGAYDRAV